MFDIGLQELLLIMVVGLLVLGPERLPQAVRTVTLWLGRARRTFNHLRREFEREIGADEIKRDLHNESVLQSLKETEQEIRSIGGGLKSDLSKVKTDLEKLPAGIQDDLNPEQRNKSGDP